MTSRPRTLVLVTALSLMAQPALACACCKEPGERITRPLTLDGIYRDDLRDIRTDGRAEVHTTACDFDCITGLLPPTGAYDATFDVTADTWTLRLTDAAQANLSLTAPLPETFTHFATDPAPDSATGTGNPGGLYTELRFDLSMTGDGSGWTGGTAPVPAQLILIGYGTACADLRMARHWMLDVTGGDAATFRLFGTIARDS